MTHTRNHFIQPFLRWLASLTLLLALAACGGGGGGGSSGSGSLPTAPVAKVEIIQTGLLLTQTGEAKQLSVKVTDAAGNVLNVPATWTSSTPAHISVDAAGKVTAASSNGASQIVAAAGGIESAPLLAVVTQPIQNAILLTDAQIVGETVETTPDAAPSFDNTYQVSLTGVAAPSVGSILISTESKAVVGRVLLVDSTSTPIKVTLGLISLREAFPTLNINETLDLAKAEVIIPDAIAAAYDVKRTGNTFEFTPKTTAAPAGMARAKALTPVGTSALPPFTSCTPALLGAAGSGSLPIALGAPPLFSVNINPTFELVYTRATGLERLVVNAEPTVSFEGGVNVTAAFEGKIVCKIEDLLTFVIPVGGPLSFFVGGVIPLGIDMEVGGKVTVATLGIGGKAEAKVKAKAGIACPGGSNCVFERGLTDFRAQFVPKFDAPTIGDARLEPFFSVFATLKAQIGNRFLRALRFTTFSAKAGVKLGGNFALPVSQLADPAYQSGYKLSLEAKAGVGDGLNEVMRLLGLASVSALELTISTDIAKSPSGLTSGAVTADRATFLAGDVVNFTVKLDPATVSFLPIIGPYNVNRIQLLRTTGGVPRVVGTATASAGQTEFNLQFTAPDFGTAGEFSAFVVTTLLPLDLLALEIGKAAGTNTVTVQPASVTVVPGASRQFGATVLGTTNGNVTWSATGGTITPTGLFTAGTTSGTFNVRATSVADPGAFAEASVTIVSSGPDIVVLNANGGQFDFDMGEPATFSINRSLYGGFSPPNSNHFFAGSPGIGFVTGTSIANPARTKEFIIINRGTTIVLVSNPALRNFESWDFDVQPGAVGGTILVTLSRPANDSHPAFTKTFTATFTHPRTPLPTVTLDGYTLDLFFELKGVLGTGINTQPGGPGQVWTWGL